MNITIITILLPYPLDSGGAQAQFNMIDALRSEHCIALVYPENAHNSTKAMKELQARWPEVSFHPFSLCRQLVHLPFLLSKVERAFKLICMPNNNRFKIERVLKPYGYDITKSFIKHVKHVIDTKQADIVEVEFYPYLKLADYIPKNVKSVFVHHEIRFVRNNRFLEQLTPKPKDIAFNNLLKKEEIDYLNKYDIVITLTEEDKHVLKSNGVSSEICVSPAAVSTGSKPVIPWNRSLVFVGGFGHGPNVEGLSWLAEKVFPLIRWSNYPNLHFKIIGKGWPEHFLPSVNGLKVDYCGFVNHLEDAAYGGIMLVPILSGSGMRMKILEASALSMPIVTTTVGVEGIGLINEQSCLMADSPKNFAVAITRLIEDDLLRKRLAKNANQVFNSAYSLETLTKRRSEIFNHLCCR